MEVESGAILTDMASNCPLLRRIEVTGTVHAPAETWRAVAKGCPLLEVVDVSGCKGITDDFLFALAKNCPGLMDLNLSSCNEITDAGVQTVLEGCPKLHTLDISYTEVARKLATAAGKRTWSLRRGTCSLIVYNP
jgi:hypothetical protein